METKRRNSNAENALRALQAAGKQGLRNSDLIRIAGFRYVCRIFELRKQGWDIETSKEDGGLFRFTLKGRVPQSQQQNLF